jgi:hypothetical protein
MSHGGELKRVEHYLTCVILLAVELDLSQNKLEGEIPNEIFVMTSLGKSAIEGRKNHPKYAMLTLLFAVFAKSTYVFRTTS